MKNRAKRIRKRLRMNRRGMEMIQVAILIAIAVTLGLIFKTQITDFVEDTFCLLYTSFSPILAAIAIGFMMFTKNEKKRCV